MPYDDEKAEREQKKRQKVMLRKAREEEFRRGQAVSALLQHRDGREYLWWLLDIGKAIGENAFTGHALSTSFNCGEQNVGQQIMGHIIQIDPDGFLKMMKERQDEERAREAELADEDG